MVVNVFVREGLARRAFDRIRVCSSAPGDEVSDTAVLVPLVIVHMTGENHKASTHCLLPLLQHIGQHLLGRTRRVPSTVLLGIRRTCVGRMVEKNKNEIYIGGNCV